jgi:hypothetical protein
MAKQKGISRFTGTVDGITYYESKYGPLVRKKGGPSKEQIKKLPSFTRVRENNKEFGSCGSATKLLRSVLHQLMKDASDYLVTSRLNKLMFAIKNLDTISPRGERNVATGILSPAAKDLIKGFGFNEMAPLHRILKKPLTVNTSTGAIGIPGLIPNQDIDWPAGATHAKFTGAWLRVDFAGGKADIAGSNIVALPNNSAASFVTLTPVSTPTGSGTDIFVLQIVFYQEVNGVQYVLKNGEFNSMAIVELN